MNNIVKRLPKLYGISSTGKIKEWSSHVESRDGSGVIVTASGYQGGTMQTFEKIIASGKNIGKSNETTPVEQAISQATSSYNKKIDSQYSTEVPDADAAEGLPLPMLAHDYTKRCHDIKWKDGVWLQPKLDGVRCLATKIDEETIRYSSRGGKVFDTLSGFSEDLIAVMDVGDIMDGEVYSTEITFQELVGAVKRGLDSGNRKHLQYHIYDIASSDSDFEVRVMDIAKKITDSSLIKAVETRWSNSEEDVESTLEEFLELGYEGLMLRNTKGKYRKKHRSKDLQKLKPFFDEEYIIVDGKEGEGRAAGQVVFICETEDGKRFSVRPKGSDQERRDMFENLNTLIGHQLTVRLQEKTDGGIPRFPVGICIRDYE